MVYESLDEIKGKKAENTAEHYQRLGGMTDCFNYVRNSGAGRFIYNSEVGRRFVSEAKDKLKALDGHIRLPSSAKEKLPKIVGTSSCLATLGVTGGFSTNLFSKVSEVLFYVTETTNGKLLDTLHHRYLDSQETAFYNAAKANVGGIPILKIVAVALPVISSFAAYEISKKTTERALKSLKES